MNEKRKSFKPDDLGAWVSSCDNRMYAKHARCRVCGKTSDDHLLSRPETAQPQRPHDKALDFPVRRQKSLLAFDRPVRIRITRGFGSSGPLDRDNLLGCCKAIRDQITEKILGLDDDRESESLAWEYAQKKGAGIMIEIFEKDNNSNE